MRKVTLDEWVTLDGFAARPDGSLDFFVDPKYSVQADEDMKKFMEGVDTILLGAATYKMFVDYWPKATTDKELMADVINTTPKLVFSNSLKEAPWGKWAPATVVPGKVEDEVRKLKKQSGKDMVLWGSLSIASALLEAKLIDRLQLRICPTAIGKGKRFYPENEPNLKTKLVGEKRYDSGAVLLTYDL